MLWVCAKMKQGKLAIRVLWMHLHECLKAWAGSLAELDEEEQLLKTEA